ncbi:MAG: 2,4-dihydroxyhept-2-ene-1,7-dioic acid aldolase [Rhodopseudomonas sp.]|nr:2,4-dihydroxyhept-2-ene-1,7-dioic acid aldolase [Rhodopseudomonas sp.]
MAKSLKQKLRERQLTVGSWLSLSGLDSCEIMAKAGFEWLVIDMEHTAISSGRMVDLIRIIDLCGITPLVRVGANDPLLIKHAMDAGAQGIIVPMIRTAEEMAAAVSSAYYPPTGTRGVGLFRAQDYGRSFPEYRERAGRETVVIAQIEHKDAVENLDAILAVDGVDGFLIGPYDLSGSLGKPGDFESAAFKACMAKVTDALKNAPVPGGVHLVHPQRDQLKKLADEGYKFLVYGVDQIFLVNAIVGEAAFAHELVETSK